MEVMIERCCGIDVHQKTIVCCILSGPLETNKPQKHQKTFGTTSAELRAALEWIQSFNVTDIFMESTGQYWVPVFNIFSDSEIQLTLANPAHIKNVPGRKTDVKDAEWIAQLGRCGLIQSSYLPCAQAMELRQLTRRRLSYIQKRTQSKNEIHNILQRANIKLTSYLSDIFGQTGQALLSLFIHGEKITLERVAECMHTHVKATPKQLLEAMDGKMSKTDRRLLDDSLEEYRFYTEKIKRMDGDIEEFILTYFKEEYELLMELPGVKANSAAVILAEIGPDVEAFKTAAHLASWAGLSPGSYESAGVKKSSRTTRGNKYLKTTLIACGGIAGRSMDPAFSNLYQRLSARGAKMKAVVACGHKLLRIIYKVLSCHIHYDKQKALGLRQQN
ncbi:MULTISPECIES: IS110 family transposase [Globicatella]|uniref:IS110 family transposase n=1 Tax=Globicatella TaxID=13075 RepID=UPI0008F8CF1C|nr:MULTISPECIES: IS110 family transposase [Globicatella]WIK65817.1 IS110 family transposase [Globicatella sanguinis]WIK67130.1 IS110 family transposase [Globicatella sanguinis]WIK67230.1 IS110 family transposase [Globicatella sanguinis]WKT55222.1 IS110 family transposase [Globicatella sanguinis]WKT56535.1 IS110 family transposase [Globicatella sanguinis]